MIACETQQGYHAEFKGGFACTASAGGQEGMTEELPFFRARTPRPAPAFEAQPASGLP